MESLSLDEIIQKKFVGGAASKVFAQKQLQRKFENPKKVNRPIFKETQRVTDARLKIIEMKRERIIDARDKIVEISRSKGDARLRLIEKGRHRYGASEVNGKFQNGHQQQRKVVPTQKKLYYNARKANGTNNYQRESLQQQHQQQHQEHTVQVPRGYIDYDNMEQMEQEEYATAKRLVRTVRNEPPHIRERSYSPTRPPYITNQGLSEPRFVSWGNRESRFDISKVPDIMDIPSNRLDLTGRRSSPELYQRRYMPEPKSQLSYEMRSRLERAPDPHASMGIFSNPQKMLQHQSPVLGRIVVSNLNSNVLHSDVVELFEDVGELYTARIVRPGVAEVIYKSLEDAKKAVETYHNRQLDGQPMKCLLVNPRATNKPTAPAINSRLDADDKDSLEIDIDALHKVLFRRN